MSRQKGIFQGYAIIPISCIDIPGCFSSGYSWFSFDKAFDRISYHKHRGRFLFAQSANGIAHPQPGLLLMIIEPKPVRGGNGQKPRVAGCRVERGLGV